MNKIDGKLYELHGIKSVTPVVADPVVDKRVHRINNKMQESIVNM